MHRANAQFVKLVWQSTSLQEIQVVESGI